MNASGKNESKHTVDEGVQDGHGTVGDTGVWVNLLEDWGQNALAFDQRERMRDGCGCAERLTLVDVGRVGLLSGLGALLLLARWGGGLLASLLLLGWGLSASWGLAAGCGSLGCCFWCHCEGWSLIKRVVGCGWMGWGMKSGEKQRLLMGDEERRTVDGGHERYLWKARGAC
jgi:hypothetical protein